MQGADGLLYGSTSLGGTSGLGVLFRVDPAAPVAASLTSVTLNPAQVTGGSSSTGTVTLTGPAPVRLTPSARAGAAVVTLDSTTPSVASVPATVSVPAGVTSATFIVSTTNVSSTKAVTISASYGGVTKAVVLTVTP